MRLCLEALAANNGPLTHPVRISIQSNGSEIIFAVPIEQLRELMATASQDEVSPLERSILSAAGPAPLPAKRLAALLKRPCNSHFREALRSLVRRNLLTHGPEGYRLPPVK